MPQNLLMSSEEWEQVNQDRYLKKPNPCIKLIIRWKWDHKQHIRGIFQSFTKMLFMRKSLNRDQWAEDLLVVVSRGSTDVYKVQLLVVKSVMILHNQLKILCQLLLTLEVECGQWNHTKLLSHSTLRDTKLKDYLSKSQFLKARVKIQKENSIVVL